MKTFTKKLLASFAAVASGLCPFNAAAYDFEVDGIYYDLVSVDEQTCAVSVPAEGTVYSGDITIPDVVPFGGRSFKVIAVKEYAFNGNQVENVVLGDNVLTIEYGAFAGSTLKNIVFDNSLKEISAFAFNYCEQLTDVVFPESLEFIGNDAFAQAYNLSSVKFNDGLKAIEHSAFRNTSLKEVILPKNLTRMGGGPNDWDYGNMFLECTSLEHVVLPEKLEYLCPGAFGGCTNLKSIFIPDNITIIGERAFENSGLTEFLGGNGIETIAYGVFSDCKSLETVNLGPKMKSIMYNAFYGCDKIKTINSRSLEAPTLETYDGETAFEKLVYVNANLYIPSEAEESYKSAPEWKDFWNIKVTYNLCTEVAEGNGKVTIENYDNNPAIIIGGQDATVTFEPGYGYYTGKVTLNGEDITSKLADNTYTIKNISENIAIEVSYYQIMVPMSLSTAESGELITDVAYGSQLSYGIVPSEGWKISTVMFNEEDVTETLIGNTFTTPRIESPSKLNVVFEKIDDAVESISGANAPRILIQGETVIVSNADESDSIAVYDMEGRQILQTSERQFRLASGSVYLIKIGTRTFKARI